MCFRNNIKETSKLIYGAILKKNSMKFQKILDLIQKMKLITYRINLRNLRIICMGFGSLPQLAKKDKNTLEQMAQIAGELFSNRICKNNYTFQLNYISSLNLVIKKDGYNYLNMH